MAEFHEKNDLIDIGALLGRLFRHKPIVGFAMLIVGAVCGLFAWISPSIYQVKTKIIYQASSKSGGNLAALASLAGVSLGGGDVDASAYLGDILKSDDLLELLVERSWAVSEVSLYAEDSVFLEELWRIEVDTTKPNWQERKLSSLLGRLSSDNYISFSQDKKSGVITLTTEFEDPRVAYDVNVFLFQELNNTLVNKMNFKAGANRKFIEGRLDEVKQDLARSENVLRAYKERNRLRLDPSDVLEESRLQRNVLINQEVMIQLQKQYEMAKIEEAKDLPVLDIIDSPRMPVEKSKPQRKKIVLAGLVIGLLLGALAAISYDLWLERKTGSKAA